MAILVPALLGQVSRILGCTPRSRRKDLVDDSGSSSYLLLRDSNYRPAMDVMGGETMSRRKNGTLSAAMQRGLNPYGWGNGKGRKRPREYQTIKNDPPLLEQQEDQNKIRK